MVVPKPSSSSALAISSSLHAFGWENDDAWTLLSTWGMMQVVQIPWKSGRPNLLIVESLFCLFRRCSCNLFISWTQQVSGCLKRLFGLQVWSTCYETLQRVFLSEPRGCRWTRLLSPSLLPQESILTSYDRFVIILLDKRWLISLNSNHCIWTAWSFCLDNPRSCHQECNIALNLATWAIVYLLPFLFQLLINLRDIQKKSVLRNSQCAVRDYTKYSSVQIYDIYTRGAVVIPLTSSAMESSRPEVSREPIQIDIRFDWIYSTEKGALTCVIQTKKRPRFHGLRLNLWRSLVCNAGKMRKDIEKLKEQETWVNVFKLLSMEDNSSIYCVYAIVNEFAGREVVQEGERGRRERGGGGEGRGVDAR